MSSIEKLELVRITGPLEQQSHAIIACLNSQAFHLENAARILAGSDENPSAVVQSNPYEALLKKLMNLDLRNVKLSREKMPDASEFTAEIIERELERISASVKDKREALQESQSLMTECQNALVHLSHLQKSEHDLGKLLHCRHIVCRFGKLPEENLEKLDFYASQSFVFTKYDSAHAYAWGFYFSTPDQIASVDQIMRGLLFEEFHIPDFVQGTPAEAMEELEKTVSEKKTAITALEQELSAIYEAESDLIARMYRFMRYQNSVYKLREQCAVVRGKNFCLMGYIPVSQKESFQKCIDQVPNLTVGYEEPWTDSKMQPPVLLKNDRFSKPFAMFTEMYGLPSYHGFNPTTLLAITYTLLFGIMFGDVGQGLLMFLIGLFLDKKKKMPLGAIISRIGLSSAFFGVIYGSVFGYEHLLDVPFEKLGIPFLPLHAMEHTNVFIFGAIGIGALMILLSIVVNVVIRLKQKNYAEAVFGNNGIFGFVFFAALLGIVIGILTGIRVVSVPYIIFLVVLPLLGMFFREPLGALVAGKPIEFESAGDFIASNFFECFEFLLGYATNTLSFIRVGGFVFSHAGLMSVVMLLADMTGKAASPFVVIFGNLFVMCLEGLIVGIQVLRLEFYEIFSRCYDGDGKPFVPITVSFDVTSDSVSE